MKKLALITLALVLTGITASAQKFAFVNTDYILENVPEFRDAQKQLDALSVNWQKEIENKYTEIDKMYKSYQAEQILLTEDMKKKRESEIIAKEKEVKDLQKQRFGKDGDLFKKRQELVKPIQDKVYNAVKKLATDGSYMVIFDKTSESVAMLYTNAKYDKSDDVLNIMGIKPGAKAGTTGTKAGDSKTGSDSKTGTEGGTREAQPSRDTQPTREGQPTREQSQPAKPR